MLLNLFIFTFLLGEKYYLYVAFNLNFSYEWAWEYFPVYGSYAFFSVDCSHLLLFYWVVYIVLLICKCLLYIKECLYFFYDKLINSFPGFCCCCCCCCCQVASVVSDSVRPPRRQPIRLPRPWDSPGKNTGVGCYFLLQCMKVKSESEVAQSCPTLRDPMDYSLPGSSAHGIFQARVLSNFVIFLFQKIKCLIKFITWKIISRFCFILKQDNLKSFNIYSITFTL